MISSKKNRTLFLLAVLLLFSGNLSAQIKKDIQRQQQQKQYEQQRKANEAKEKSRVSKAQLTLQELQQLADLKDAIEVDKILTAKGWMMYKTETESDIETITYTFDKEKYNERALYWAYWNRDRTNSDKIWISWRFSDDDIFHQLEKSLTSHKYVKQSSKVRESDDAGIQTVYRNNTYEVQIVKKPKETYGGDPAYSVTCRNHKRETEKLDKERERAENSTFSIEELLSIVKAATKSEIESIIKDKGFIYNLEWERVSPIKDSSTFYNYLFTEDVLLFTADYFDDFDDISFDNLLNFLEVYPCGAPYNPVVFFFNDIADDNILILHGEDPVTFNKLHEDLKHSDFVLLTIDSTDESEDNYSKEFLEIYTYQDYKIFFSYSYDDDCIPNSFVILNLWQLEMREAEYERKVREKAEQERLEREKNAKYKEALDLADMSYSKGDLESTIISLKDAMSIKPEKSNELSLRIENIEKEIRINSLVHSADSLCQLEQFELAKQYYNNALSISPNPKREIILDKIAETDTIVTILSERTTRWYNYESLQFADYLHKSNFLTNGIKNYLFQLDNNIPLTTLNFQYEIDTLNHTSYDITHSDKADRKFLKYANGLADEVRLLPCNLKGYPVNAQVSFVFDVSYKHADVTVRKKPSGTFSKHKEFSFYRSDINHLMGNDAPYARYSFSLSRVHMNEQEFSDNKMTKVKVIGGPANAWLSLLIPGLGDHRVTYGKRKGIGITLSTYLLAGAGVGCFLYNHYYPKNS